MQERRKFKRINANTIVMYIIQDYLKYNDKHINEIGTPISSDISEGGMKIITEQDIPLDTYLKIIFSVESSKTSIETIGQVTWNKKEAEQKHYQIGIKFINYLNNSREQLQKILQNKN